MVRSRDKRGRTGRELSAESKAAIHHQRNLAICLGMAVVTFALYLPVSGHPFINYDDDNYVTKNPHVQAGLAWTTVTWALTSTEHDNWHPLTWYSHALDFQLYGPDPDGHHVTNVLLHVLNVALLFFLLVRATGGTGRSLLVAALFALHPFNVESVAWVAERKNVLSTLFLLLTLGAYGWYARQPGVRRYLVVAALFLAGLASKPMVITLPCVLLLLDFWPLERIQGWGQGATQNLVGSKDQRLPKRRSAEAAFPVPQQPFLRLALEKLPLLVLSAADGAITLFAQHTGGAMRLALSPGVRLENAIYAYAMYVWKAFWPVGLAPFYPHPGATLARWQLGGATLFLIGVSVLVWQERFTRRYLVTGWLWFLGTLVPVIGLVQVGEQAMADRYAYVPLIGIFLMLAFGAADLADRQPLSFPARMATAATILAFLSFLTWRQIGYWNSSYELWSHTVDVTRDNYIAEDNLGGALLVLGRAEEALPHFQNAARINPRDPTSHLDTAAVLAQSGRPQEAIEAYQNAMPLVTDPRITPIVYENVGLLYANLGNYAKARESYQQALQIDPERTSARTALVNLDLTEAMKTVSEHPTAEGYLRVGRLLQQAGHVLEASTAYTQALKLDPGLGDARKALDALKTGNP